MTFSIKVASHLLYTLIYLLIGLWLNVLSYISLNQFSMAVRRLGCIQTEYAVRFMSSDVHLKWKYV
jgi:hypothetical protein